jgi:ketohexokinase
MKILGVGIVTLDIINLVNHYPQEDEELRADNQFVSRGGNTANTLTILSQFNHHCYWCGTLANDSSAQDIYNDFNENNINFSYAKKLDHGKQPTSYITLNKHNGSRTIVHYRDLPELDFSHFSGIPLDNFEWIHFEARAIDEIMPMMKLVKSHYPEIKVSIEVEKPRDQLQDIFNLADIYLFSKAYANELDFQNAKDFLNQQKKHSPKADLVCSWGKQGAYALLRNNVFLSSPAFPPEKIIDTIGAGDTFNAALIHSLLTENSWQDSLTFACKIAGKKCGQLGFKNLASKE